MKKASNARGRRTRLALLEAMRTLLEEQGFEALTMSAVAERAGVSRRAVYLHFDSRADLVNELFDHVAEIKGLRESTARIWEQPDSAAALDEWARHLARYHPRIVPVARALERVRHIDPDAARHREKVVRAQMKTCRRLAEWLDRDGRLAAEWTVESAADMLWALISIETLDKLLDDRRWSQRQLAERLSVLFRATFVR